MIKKRNGKFILYTSDGSRVLGTHNTLKEALAQERAIYASKKRRGKG